MSNIYYVAEYKKHKDIEPIKISTIAQYPYEIASGVGDDISVNKKVYIIAKINYVCGGDFVVCRNFYVADKFSKEVK